MASSATCLSSSLERPSARARRVREWIAPSGEGSDGEGKLHQAKCVAFDRTGLRTGPPKGGEGTPDVGIVLCDPTRARGQVLGYFRHEFLLSN
jgi:hypothetical protein